MTRPTDRIKAGDRFGMLTVSSLVGNSADRHRVWLCICDCGSSCEKKTNVLRASQRNNSRTSCGCIAEEVNREQATKHGMRGSRTYTSWQAAIERCHNPTSKDYQRYGAIGVSVCDEWRKSFEAFRRDMGDRPEGTSLDRWPNPSGNYEPANCRWATPKEQANNRRNTVIVVGRNDEQKTLSSVAEELGISYGAASMRLKRGKLNDYHRV